MKAMRFCLSVVRRGQPAARPRLGKDVVEVSAFLVSHVESLLAGASSGTAPIAELGTGGVSNHFDVLRDGSEQEFLDAADTLTKSLVSEMSRVNSKEGVLVCATFEQPGQGRLAAALKLQVVSDHGAVLERLDSGDLALSAVERVLDRPGELQKGLVYPDPRPDSQAVVGDKANQREARYFLVAMGAVAEEHGKKALGDVAEALLGAVAQADGPAVIRQLGSADQGTVGDVVAAATQGLTMTRPVEEIVEELENRERPIRNVNTRAPLKATIRSGTVKVDLRSLDLERVNIEPVAGGGWDITIHVDAEPTVRYHS
jgi:hypothetical protein